VYRLAAALTCNTLLLRERLATLAAKERDGGFTTETVIIIAALALLAIAVVSIIASKVINKANGINLG
jgi:hypothetical protein